MIEVIQDHDAWAAVDLDALAGAAVSAALSHLGLDPEEWEVAVLACDDARIAELNADFRDKPRPTNVLSWPSEERGVSEAGGKPPVPEPSMGPPDELGDIAIAYETCAREAEAAGKPMETHVRHLLVHATLHLLGYDHETEPDAELMEGLETQILATLGDPDPYSE
ncbi:rRNA maturation RNase YbeY [Tranquillimonas alkanivorans]|uniref:Endoribonuclease YbeY n=1 Tax=Tranquillimonas alkanivorans TaxID=441119 RepID=A0A1I5KR19_9RHOB|nr:rRNA maturation RNase YbeY [Tranquillimonas alkanivorans]SFO87445.1 probable rRNA maturation factor [Tranquillimonas alkanivorans]